MQSTTIEILASALFAIAILHTLFANRFQILACRYPQGSVPENLFHLLGEVEVVFGLWAGIFIIAYAAISGPGNAIAYAESLKFTEPLFVFAVMTIAATKPVIELARLLILSISRLIPFNREISTYFCCLTIGPLLGSLITEPAAMTVTALILKERYFADASSAKIKYLTIAVLFVNVSIGGVLTHFAAPPVLMVAGIWNWDLAHMLTHFGWKAAIAVTVNALLASAFLRSEIVTLTSQLGSPSPDNRLSTPWLTFVHLAFLASVIITAHHPVIFIGLLLFFLGIAAVTAELQESLKLKESLLVSFFLGGLVVLGTPQKWWLQPAIASLDDIGLFLSAAGLTAFTDNAALTFLGAQIGNIADSQKYALVAGAVAAGGLTVIANAPNPAGYTILQERFGSEGIRPFTLMSYAAIPTLVAGACLWFL